MLSQPKHILGVDDDVDVRDVIVAILNDYNFRVSNAASGSLMRDFLQTADPVDCVVLDALMPGEANISLVLHLKEVRSSCCNDFRKPRRDGARRRE
jgi:DNA-binding NtrC family response regulator